MMTTSRAKRVTALVGAAVFSGVAIGLAPATTAYAVECEVTTAFNPSSVEVEYGQTWSFQVTGTGNFDSVVRYDGLAIASTGAPAGYLPAIAADYNGASYTLFHPYETTPLNAGTYTFALSVKPGFVHGLCDSWTGSSVPSGTLKITPAAMGIELRVLADPTNAEDAIVTARFTGRFADEYYSSFFPGAAVSPAGVWQIVIKDSAGEVATERSIERAAGDDVLATSFYWADAEPGEQYSASATFVPEGSSAGNFAIAPAADFPYTAAESQRPTPVSSATAKPDASLPEATSFGLPLWSVILAVVLIVGLAVLVTIVSVRLSRRSTATTVEVAE